MAIEDINVQGYGMEYPPMNLKLFKTDKKTYDMCVITAHIEGINNGFKVKKIGKATKKGTRITFTTIKSKEDLKQYSIKIRELLNQFNKNYGTNYTL